jgi:hypothetical protein
MSILWCGGEDIDFPNGFSPAVNTSATYSRAGYARCAVSIQTVSNMIRSALFPGGALTSLWFSVRAYVQDLGTTNNRGRIGLGKSGTNNGLYLGRGSSAGKMALLKYEGGIWSNLAEEAGTSLGSALRKIDVQVIDHGAAATVNVYLDGNQVIALVGDTTISGVTGLDSIIATCTANSEYWHLSEAIVADEDTRLMSLVTQAPNLAGDANAWTGLYTDIDETTLNDADLLYTNAAGNGAQFNTIDLPAGTFTIKAVRVAARAAKSASSTPTKVALGIKTGGTVDLDVGQSCTTAWQTLERLMAQNPVTTNDWQQSEMNALQLAVGSVA